MSDHLSPKIDCSNQDTIGQLWEATRQNAAVWRLVVEVLNEMRVERHEVGPSGHTTIATHHATWMVEHGQVVIRVGPVHTWR